jgi:prevent-host-death family protein
MKEITATKARRKWGDFMKSVQEGPVLVSKSGKPGAVALSAELYHQLVASSSTNRTVTPAQK